MAMTWSAESKKAANDARVALLNSGFIAIYTTGFGTLLGTVNLAATAFGASTLASPSVSTAGTITRDASADATGTAAVFRYLKADGVTMVGEGSVTATGGGGDCELATTSIVATQPIEITACTITQP